MVERVATGLVDEFEMVVLTIEVAHSFHVTRNVGKTKSASIVSYLMPDLLALDFCSASADKCVYLVGGKRLPKLTILLPEMVHNERSPMYALRSPKALEFGAATMQGYAY